MCSWIEFIVSLKISPAQTLTILTSIIIKSKILPTNFPQGIKNMETFLADHVQQNLSNLLVEKLFLVLGE